MKKLRVFVIIVPLLLFIAEEKAQALPMPEMVRHRYESRPSEEEPIPPTANKTDSTRTPSKAKATGGKKVRAVARKHRHGSAKTAGRHTRRKSLRYSATARARERLRIIKDDYTRQTHKPLVVTSFGRDSSQQARAIRGLIRRHGVAYVLNLYRHGSNIKEILAAYRKNRRHPQQAQHEMTRVITSQIADGRYVSKHLRGLAVDIRSHGRGAARLSVLRAVARKAGATVLVEPECFHLNLV
jgi:hypothetical protein